MTDNILLTKYISSVHNKQTSQTNSNYNEHFESVLQAINKRRYDSEFLSRLRKLGVSERKIYAYENCSTRWMCKEENGNIFYFLNSCHVKGCPCCSTKSLKALVFQYMPNFVMQQNVRFITYTWSKTPLNEESVQKKNKNIKALDKRLERAGYVNKGLVRSWECRDEESKSVEEGIHHHCHELRSGYVDINKMDQPFRNIIVKDKYGNIKYQGMCGLFEEINYSDGKKTLQIDGYLNQFVLSKLWEEITQDSIIIDIRRVYDVEHDLGYVLKYSSKSPRFKFPENLKAYLDVFQNKKSVINCKLDKNKTYRKLKVKIINSDTNDKFPPLRREFDHLKESIKESRYTLQIWNIYRKVRSKNGPLYLNSHIVEELLYQKNIIKFEGCGQDLDVERPENSIIRPHLSLIEEPTPIEDFREELRHLFSDIDELIFNYRFDKEIAMLCFYGEICTRAKGVIQWLK